MISDGDQRIQKGLEVLVLDRDMKVVLKSAPDETKTAATAPHERYPLRRYGTEHLRGNFSTSVSMLDDNPIYQQTTHLIIAFTIVKSSSLRRVAKPRQNEKPKDDLRCLESLEHWRIFHAADLIFHDIPYNRAEIDSYIQLLKTPLLQEISLSNSLELHLKRRIDAQGIENAEDKKLNLAWIRRELELLMVELATLILMFAHVSEIKDCYAVPLVFDINSLLKRSSIYEQLFDGDPVTLEEATIFYVAGLLVGSSFASKDHKNSFLISDFGWSIFLNCCNDSDPAKVRPELIHVRHRRAHQRPNTRAQIPRRGHTYISQLAPRHHGLRPRRTVRAPLRDRRHEQNRVLHQPRQQVSPQHPLRDRSPVPNYIPQRRDLHLLPQASSQPLDHIRD